MAAARILIVEDEPLVSMMAVEALSDIGFICEEAANAAEALQKLRGPDRFDAVILDMRLPDRSGDDLAREIRAIRSDLAIVIASGYDKGPLQELFAADPRIVVVAKPYLGNDLRQALERLGVESREPTQPSRPPP
jgi:CheY-like chemotaxis protein